MKRLLATAAALVLAASLTGCGTGSDEPTESEREKYALDFMDSGTFNKKLPDGRTVLCIWAEEGYAGGLSCDWDNAK